MAHQDLCSLSATELARMIRRKKVSPVEVIRAVLAQIEKLNPALNAFVLTTAEQALKDARAAERAAMRTGAALGPLHGVPFSTKDVVATKGIPTTFGTRLYRDNVPSVASPCTHRARRGASPMLGR